VVGTGVLGWVSFWSERGLKEFVRPGLRSWAKVLAGAFRDRPEVQVGPKVEAGARKWNWVQKSRGTLGTIVTEVRWFERPGSEVSRFSRKGSPTPAHWGAGTFGFCSSALMSLVSGFASAACFFICSHGAYARARAGHVCDRVWSALVQGQGAQRRGSRKGG
jgi:hypothetical protein